MTNRTARSVLSATMGDKVRSALFAVTFYPVTAAYITVLLPLLLLPAKLIRRACYTWIAIFGFFCRYVLRLTHRVEIAPEAAEAMRNGPVIIAAKHQSMWETLAFNTMIDHPSFVLKEELTRIPLFGLFLKKFGMIAVDRSAGMSALKAMVQQAEEELAKGRSVVIYPQGTRVAPDAALPYHPGVAALYAKLDVPLIPVALDSGRFWPRHRFIKRAGTITVRFLPPMERGLDRRRFMKELEERIESACG